MRAPPLWGVALLLPLLASPVLGVVDGPIRSLWFQLRGVRPAPPDPVVLAVDAESLALEQLLPPPRRAASPLWSRMGPWPWPRALQADLAAAVLERGAARVVINIVHAQPSRYGPADDQAFVRRLAPWGDRVVLAAAYRQGSRGGVEQAQLERPIHPFAAVGLTALLQSPRGVTEAIPGRAWLAASLAGFPPPHPPPLAYAASARGLPALPEAPLLIDFPGPAGTVPSVPAWQVLEQPPGFWRGRLVLIGGTAPELGDQQETPFGPQSGTEVQAAAIGNLLEGRGFRPLPAPLLPGLLLLWGGLAAAGLRRCDTAIRTVAFGLAAAAAGLLLTGSAWWAAHSAWPVTALVASPLLGGVVRGSGQWWRENRERAYLHQVLARRVSPTLLADILREPAPFWNQVGGSRAHCVVLFTDLVGFTPLSAQLDPTDLFALLNRYFEAIAAAVIEEQGLLDKFIGDSLMAEFGVPRSRGDREEVRAAARAALAMQRRLEALNRELAQQGLPPLRQGIGLHFGEVIAGNLGSSQRLEFSVVGAAVNVASRLEGLTRRFPEHPILISEAVRRLLPEGWPVEALGTHPLKGWPEPIAVFALGHPGGPPA